jgi:hypothetical protein
VVVLRSQKIVEVGMLLLLVEVQGVKAGNEVWKMCMGW